MTLGSPPILRCPDCFVEAGLLGAVFACPACDRSFGPQAGLWDLRPSQLSPAKRNEDAAHHGDRTATWRRLILHKRDRIEACDTQWLPELLSDRTRRFLEVGGGLCYASALAKARAPDAHVTASDLSPKYVIRHAMAVGSMLGAMPNAYVAADVERLPFIDAQFDAVFSQMTLYRVPAPSEALREIRRVLAPGGCYLGIERATPWAWSREASVMRARAEPLGILERPYTLHAWRAMARGIARADLTPGRRLRHRRARQWLNAVRPMHVALRIAC